jgi:hypothetical protein
MTAAASPASHGQSMARSFSTGKYTLAMPVIGTQAATGGHRP